MERISKKWRYIVVLLALGAIFYAGASQVGKTSYKTLRSSVAAASVESDLSATQKTWAYYKANLTVGLGYSVNVPQNVGVVFTFSHTNADTDTATFIVYGYKEGGPAEFVASGNLTAGAQISDASRYYADTIGTQVERWAGAIDWVDADGDNGVAKLIIDSLDYSYFVVLFTAISAADSVACDVTWFDVNGD